MQSKYEADGKARVAEALANGKKWDALTEGAKNSDVGRTALGIVAAVSETKSQLQLSSGSSESMKQPRDWLDTTIAVGQMLTGVARVAVDWKGIVVGGEVRKAEIAGRVEEKKVDGATQLGIVDTLAKNAGSRVTVTAGGDAAGGNQDKRDCSSKGGTAGNGAGSGSGGSGSAAGSGSGAGNAAAAPGAPSGFGGSGGAGGAAGGNCGS